MLVGPLGRLGIRRESDVYRCLDGVPGIPRALGLAGGIHLVLEFVAGPSLRTQEAHLAERERFFRRLLDTILAMHAVGVAHGDLKRKDNIVVGPDETPYIIDFGIARLRGTRPGPVRRLVFEQVRQMDLNAWIKLKYGRKPTDLSPDDAALYRPLWIERIARAVRVPWQKLTLRRPRQRWQRRWREWREHRGRRF